MNSLTGQAHMHARHWIPARCWLFWQTFFFKGQKDHEAAPAERSSGAALAFFPPGFSRPPQRDPLITTPAVGARFDRKGELR